MAKIIMEMGKGPQPILTACPTIIVGVLTDDQPDFTTVAWTGVACSNPPHVSIALQHQRHSLKGIRQKMVFSVNIPSEALLRETDYCGLVSGSKADKARDCHFKVFFGKIEKAPFIEQCPVNHACEVVQILNLGSHELIIGKIIETHISEEYMTAGRLDTAKMRPVLFAGMGYYALGNYLGQPFKIGREIQPGAPLDAQ
jgi:flavin reductase (DIM6/NTAB) family NADH-FMN oxidoreductase RutF